MKFRLVRWFEKDVCCHLRFRLAPIPVQSRELYTPALHTPTVMPWLRPPSVRRLKLCLSLFLNLVSRPWFLHWRFLPVRHGQSLLTPEITHRYLSQLFSSHLRKLSSSMFLTPILRYLSALSHRQIQLIPSYHLPKHNLAQSLRQTPS